MKRLAIECLSRRRISPRIYSVILLLGCAATAFAAKSAANKEDLRKLASLPPMNFSASVNFVRGQLRWQQDLVAPDEIARLKKEMHGDSSDALRLLQLSRLLDDAGFTNEAVLTCSNAVSAFRRQVEQRPKDGLLLSHFGEALASAGQYEEAGAVLRRAVTIAPKESECWNALGRFLSTMSDSDLYPDKTPPELSDSPVLLVTKYKPTAAQFERAEKRSKESLECYDKAIALAPKDAALFERRASSRVTAAFIQTVKQQISASQPDPVALAGVALSPDCLPDLRRAAELDRENPSRVAAVAFYELSCAAFALNKSGVDLERENLWNVLPTDQAKSIRWKLDQLKELTESPSKEKASEAAKFCGLLEFILLRDKSGAEASLRRATALNPKNDQAWEALMLTLTQEKRYYEMVSVCEARVKANPSSRSHLCLAKAQEKLNHWDKVVEETQAAVRASTNEFLPKLALASALLHIGDDKQANEAAADCLKIDLAERQQAGKDVNAHAAFIGGLMVALGGDVDKARGLFQLVLKLDPDHDGAKAALNIIESWK